MITDYLSQLDIKPELARDLLTTFIRQEMGRIGIKNAILGLSGGLDSALCAYLAVEALGPDNVILVSMPYRLSSKESVEHARLASSSLGVSHYYEIDISDQVDAYFANSSIPGGSSDTHRQNRQGNKMARERMSILYDLSYHHHALVLGTSNKSELLLGYGTIFGDLASAINPLGDLYKTQVFQLSEFMGVPREICTKPPSADLWEGQSDENELGASYAMLDQILMLLVDMRCTREEVIGYGFDEQLVDMCLKRMRTNQFKRLPPVIAKLSLRTIGKDFRYSRDWGT